MLVAVIIGLCIVHIEVLSLAVLLAGGIAGLSFIFTELSRRGG